VTNYDNTVYYHRSYLQGNLKHALGVIIYITGLSSETTATHR